MLVSKSMRAGAVVLLFVTLGCSSSNSNGTPGPDPVDAAVVVGDDGTIVPVDGAPPSDAGGSTTDTASPPKLPLCIQTCSAPSDCATAGAAYDADNWSCDGGECKWLGCNSDAECASTFMSSAYACRALAGTSLKSCQRTCTKPADCVTTGGGTAYDVDNWSCESSTCLYKGCNDDAECKSSFGTAGNYVCRALSGSTMKTCVKACSSPNDCAIASAAYDADNYECEAGACRWIGCKSDAECKSSLMKPNYACR